MKIKTRNLSGIELDWAVASAAALLPKVKPIDAKGSTCALAEAVELFYLPTGRSWAPSLSWAQGGELIEIHKISTTVGHSGVWLGFISYNLMDAQRHMHAGSTALEAAMRTYVQSVLGDEVELP